MFIFNKGKNLGGRVDPSPHFEWSFQALYLILIIIFDSFFENFVEIRPEESIIKKKLFILKNIRKRFVGIWVFENS